MAWPCTGGWSREKGHSLEIETSYPSNLNILTIAFLELLLKLKITRMYLVGSVTDCDKFWRLGFKSSSENNFIDIIDVAKISCTRVKAASRLHFLSAWQMQF